MQIEYHSLPTPYAIIPELIAPALYEQIRFPDIPARPRGRIGRDIYFGEPEWSQVMAQPGWSDFASQYMSEAALKRIIGLFSYDIRRHGCAIDPDKVYLAQRAESREETEQSVLSETNDPNALFFRFDLQASDGTYSKHVHCDHRRRVIGGVLFMTDAADEGMEGGDFAIYSDRAFKNDRSCHDPQIEKVFSFQRNKGVLFLNGNTGFHGPRPISRLSGLRKWIYYSISSTRDVWSTDPQA